MANDRLRVVLERLDALNSEDPNQDQDAGTSCPRELLYARRLTDWVRRLQPNPSEALVIAARGQHVRRWEIPRSRYPMTRAGYLRWRETLKTFHAELVQEAMEEAGYPAQMVQRVTTIISKRQLANDPDTQTLEDALCLVFLETQLADLRRKTPEDKMLDIIRKTWNKMSPQARAQALTLPFAPEDLTVLRKALPPDAGKD